MSRSGRPGPRPGANRRGARGSGIQPTTAGRSAKAKRTRPVSEIDSASSSFVYRYRVGSAVIFLALLVAAAQLFNLQVPQAAGLRAQAASQLKVTDVE